MTPLSMADREGYIWLNGEMIPWKEAKVHVLTHTLHYGVGVFEGVRAYQTTKGAGIFRLQDHTDRLFRSAHILRMDMPFSKDEINEAQRAVVRENKLDAAYIRPLCFLGAEGMGLRADQLNTNVMIAAWEWPSYVSPELMEKGMKVRTSSWTRHHVNVTMCKAKAVGNYTNSILALREALESGAEETLMLDPEGYVAEGSGENIFVVTKGEVHTPELTSCLDGITRDTIIRFLDELGLKLVERRITRDEVYIAEEAFFTGTAAEVLPIQSLDGRVIGNGTRGPITEKLQRMYFDQVMGRATGYPDWITLVN